MATTDSMQAASYVTAPAAPKSGGAGDADSAMNATEQKVKALCARVIAATDEDFCSALAELRTFLRSHSEILHNETVASILGISPSDEDDSRVEAAVSS